MPPAEQRQTEPARQSRRRYRATVPLASGCSSVRRALARRCACTRCATALARVRRAAADRSRCGRHPAAHRCDCTADRRSHGAVSQGTSSRFAALLAAASASATVALVGQLALSTATARSRGVRDHAALARQHAISLCKRAARGDEGVHERRRRLLEQRLEHHRRQRIREGEAHREIHAAAVEADGRERPLALELAERARGPASW